MAEQERCETCRFWDAENTTAKVYQGASDDAVSAACCRRFPAHEFMGSEQWCGEYQSREEPV